MRVCVQRREGTDAKGSHVGHRPGEGSARARLPIAMVAMEKGVHRTARAR